jgi:hypothetical protein
LFYLSLLRIFVYKFMDFTILSSIGFVMVEDPKLGLGCLPNTLLAVLGGLASHGMEFRLAPVGWSKGAFLGTQQVAPVDSCRAHLHLRADVVAVGKLSHQEHDAWAVLVNHGSALQNSHLVLVTSF